LNETLIYVQTFSKFSLLFFFICSSSTYIQNCSYVEKILEDEELLSLAPPPTPSKLRPCVRTLILIVKPTRGTNFSNLFSNKSLHVSDSSSFIIRSFSLYTQQWYMSYRFSDSLRAGSGRNQFHPDPARKLSENLYDIYHCCLYSEKLLMMDRGIVRNM